MSHYVTETGKLIPFAKLDSHDYNKDEAIEAFVERGFDFEEIDADDPDFIEIGNMFFVFFRRWLYKYEAMDLIQDIEDRCSILVDDKMQIHFRAEYNTIGGDTGLTLALKELKK